MATRVDEFPVRYVKYPWSEWLDGTIWELTRGEDFTVKNSHMQQACGYAAKRRGVRYTTRSIGDKVYILAYHDDVAKPPPSRHGSRPPPATRAKEGG